MGRPVDAGAGRRGRAPVRFPAARAILFTLPLVGVGCVGPPVGPATVTGGGKDGGASVLAPALTRRVRRLSNHEYDNVVRDLLGDSTQPSRGFLIADSFSNGYDNGSDGLAVQSDQVLDYQLAAESLAATAVAERLPALMIGCDPAASGDDACLEAFWTYLPPRAFRRPLTGDELGRLHGVYDAGASGGGLA